MIRIAFCDDDPSALDTLSQHLETYRLQRDLQIEYTAFQSPLELLFEYERGVRFDVLFLDILMPGENGIDTAAEIRGYDNNVKIIFLTSSSDYAVQSYNVSAHFYQVKPIGAESFFCLLDSVLKELDDAQGKSVILRCKNGITRLDLRRLEYCEVIHRTLFIHLSNGEVLESIGTLEELSRNLEPYGCFLRSHRSYMVNLEHVYSLSYRAITMTSRTQIPVPRGKYNEIKNAFLEYAFQKGQVIL